MYYPVTRLRRLRKTHQLREMVRETELNVRSLIYPVFVVEGKDVKDPIASMPGMFRFSVDALLKEVKEIEGLRIPAIMLFGIPERKDERATAAYAKNGIVQTAIKAIKEKFPNLIVITDVCLCAYTPAGHCGVVKNRVAASKDEGGEDEGSPESSNGQDLVVYNDASCELLAKMALSHAEAGADMVAPSSMMDGQVGAIRKILDANNYKHISIMAYSAKFASSFYGPFRDAAGSSPETGDRKSYQMNPANSQEALREIELDIQEGADIVMVKPALAYLDIIAKAKQRYSVPLAAYNVSGEFAMVKAAASMGWIDEKEIVMEELTAMKRAGADIIITYHAKDAARWLSGKFLL
ncbi:MAG: porphobilinogen synthase [Candidatus Omnitrophica bacterium]|jgi:porphobilinogen synthase (EC 4.2.1.24)|nr:porphobilinogen synthase [Candidatus Omnitrophota bacterium]